MSVSKYLRSEDNPIWVNDAFGRRASVNVSLKDFVDGANYTFQWRNAHRVALCDPLCHEPSDRLWYVREELYNAQATELARLRSEIDRLRAVVEAADKLAEVVLDALDAWETHNKYGDLMQDLSDQEIAARLVTYQQKKEECDENKAFYMQCDQ